MPTDKIKIRAICIVDIVKFRCGLSLNKDYYDVSRNARMQINNGFYLNLAIALRMNILKNRGIMAELGYQMITGALINLDTDTRINTKQYDVFQIKGTIFFYLKWLEAFHITY